MAMLLDVSVAAIRTPCKDVRLFELCAVHGTLPPYSVGSHINVHLNLDGKQAVRSYSLIGTCEPDGRYMVAIRRMPHSRGGSAHMWTLEPGARVQISGPANNFPLSFDSPYRMLLAGGIGITPLIGMAQALKKHGADFDLFYAGRSLESMPFVDLLRETLGDRLHLGIENEGTSFQLTGTLRRLPHNAELYVCGPITMLNAVRELWAAEKRDESALRFETFANSGVVATQPFRVIVPRLGLDVEVAANETLLETLERHGAEPLYNCRKGECGLCAVEILKLEGTVDHRDVFFSHHQKANNAALCSCVSRLAGGCAVIDFP